MDRAGSLLQGKGIHDQGIAKLPRRARERTQNQDAILINPARNEFFGNQIHAVVQRVNDTEVRHQMKRYQSLLVEVAADENDRLPRPGRPSRINLLNLLAERLVQ